MKRTPWKKKPLKFEEGKWNGFKRSPMKRSSRPLNKVGKQGKENARADRLSKRELIKKGIDCCQLCGRTIGLSRSHDNKRRYESDLTRVALLCIFPCHSFIELKLDAETRQKVNSFIIDTDLEGEAKFEAVLKLLPENKAQEMYESIVNYNG